ncbi:hypothetical protein ACX801_18065 [Arthrobacter bambusae]
MSQPNLVARFRALPKRTKIILGAAAATLLVSAATVSAVTALQPVGHATPAPAAAAVSFSPTPTVSVSPSPKPTSTPGSATSSTPPAAPEAVTSPEAPAAAPEADPAAPAPAAPNAPEAVPNAAPPAAPAQQAPAPVAQAPAPVPAPAPAPAPVPAPPVGRTEGLNQSYASINNHRVASGVPGFVPLTAACSPVTTVTGTALDSYQHQDVVLGVFGRTTGAAFSKGIDYDTLTVYRCS